MMNQSASNQDLPPLADPCSAGSSPAAVSAKALEEWLYGNYYATLDVSIGTAYTYMHTTVNWTISLLTAVVVFLATRSSFPDELTWYALCACLVFVAHFAARTAKGYLNVLRWAAIQRAILAEILGVEGSDARSASAFALVQKYHLEWQSPVSYSKLLYKLFAELGFGYLLLLLLLLLIYSAERVIPSFSVIGAGVAAVVLFISELLLLRFSPYLREVSIDIPTQKLS